jgi:hypothetical protein
MATNPGRPSDDVSSAPESGTVRDNTSGNQPAHPHDRGTSATEGQTSRKSKRDREKDDPSFAGEER